MFANLARRFRHKPLGLLAWTTLLLVPLWLTSLLWPNRFRQAIYMLNDALLPVAGPLYLGFGLFCVLAVLLFWFTPLGQFKLGGRDAKPSFSTLAWLGMMFTAGMGVALLIWGASEPLFHYLHLPHAAKQEALSLAITFFHYGIHPWAIYALTTIACGLLLSHWPKDSAVTLNWGQLVAPNWPMGQRLINQLTAMTILLGMAASFAAGLLQLQSGLEAVFHIAPHSGWLWGLTLVITLAFLWSAMLGLKSGIRRFSNISMVLCGVLLLVCWVKGGVGPIVNHVGESLWVLSQVFIPLSIGNFEGTSPQWVQLWTVKYWSWWIAWAPFVALFVMLISRGRTVRSLISGLMLAPTVLSVLWFGSFGHAAIWAQQHGQALAPSNTLDWSQVTGVMFRLYEFWGLSPWLDGLTLLLLAGFFINSADSATYTLAVMSQSNQGQKPIVQQALHQHMLGWGGLMALVALSFALSGGLALLQYLTLVLVLPFTLVMLGLYWRLFQHLVQVHTQAASLPPDNRATMASRS